MKIRKSESFHYFYIKLNENYENEGWISLTETNYNNPLKSSKKMVKEKEKV